LDFPVSFLRKEKKEKKRKERKRDEEEEKNVVRTSRRCSLDAIKPVPRKMTTTLDSSLHLKRKLS
jgi:hypothetical protein